MTDKTTPTAENTDEAPAVLDITDELAGEAPAGADDEPGGSTATTSKEPAEKDGPNAEAARYRRRLREAETERDALKEKVTALQRAQLEAAAADQGLKPEALWAAGVELGELVNDDGTIDPAKAASAVRAAGDKLGVWEARKKLFVPSEGRSPRPSQGNGFTEAFRPRS